MDNPTVLICVQYYEPGFKSGGPIRSVKALVDHFGEEIDFKIITYDRDSGDDQAYAGVVTGRWLKAGGAEVFYLDKGSGYLGFVRSLYKALRTVEADTIYVQSLLNLRFTFVPLVLHSFGAISGQRFVIAPRGELSKGALGIKPKRKRVYVKFLRIFGIRSRVDWHATSGAEKREIEEVFGEEVAAKPKNIFVAPNLIPSAVSHDEHMQEKKACAKKVRVVFLSRISRKKNLHYAIQRLSECSCPIEFSIYGPVDRDSDYWDACKSMLESLPKNVCYTYHGPVQPKQVPSVLRASDLFLFPTLGENFGHVIAESLLSGCPVLISDRTPWVGLSSANVGWDISLEDPRRFVEVIEEVAKMSPEQLDSMGQEARRYALGRVNSPEVIDANRSLLVPAKKVAK